MTIVRRGVEMIRRHGVKLLLFVLGAAVFALAYCQAPLYYSNQNQYFLHGLAAAGVGRLSDDWLAQTRDPTPLFSGLVAVTVRWLRPWMFYLYDALLQGAYAVAMFGLFVALVGREIAVRRWPLFVALFVAVHAALFRWCSAHGLGVDYPYYLQAGVAGQYVLGPMLQPSTFGVLLVVALCLFVHGRPFAAVVCNAVAVSVHTTYLLPAALLTAGFLAALLLERRPYRALAVGAVALLLVLPVTLYALLTFGPTSATAFAAAQALLVNFRIPHHARPDLWLDRIAVAQLAWFGLGLGLAWRTRLFAVLAVAAALAVLLTLVQVVTHDNTLALLFPWRVSAVLIPVATTVILSRLTSAAPAVVEGTPARTAALMLVVVCVLGGVWISAAGLGVRSNDDELALLKYVRDSAQPGDVYFLPVGVPDLAATVRGAKSLDYAPLANKKAGAGISVDLQRFRLATGTPIFVDFKSIPYRDTEVLEWHERVLLVRRLQEQLRQGQQTEALAELRRRGVNHVVLPVGQTLTGPGVERVYADGQYQVYRLLDVPKGD